MLLVENDKDVPFNLFVIKKTTNSKAQILLMIPLCSTSENLGDHLIFNIGEFYCFTTF